MNPSQDDEHHQQHAASWWAYPQGPSHPGGGVGNVAPAQQPGGTGYLPAQQQHTLQHAHSAFAATQQQPNYILQPQAPLSFQAPPHEHFRLPSGSSIHASGFQHHAPPPPLPQSHAPSSSSHGLVQGMPHLSPVLAQDASTIDSSSSDTPVKKKRPQSCDACRTRKIKCVRLSPHLPAGVPESVLAAAGPGVTMSPSSVDARCSPCKAIGAECTYKYVPKRPGPQTSLVKGIKRDPTERKRSNSSAAASGKAALTKGKRKSPDRPKSQPSSSKESKTAAALAFSGLADGNSSSSSISSVGGPSTLSSFGVPSSPAQSSMLPLRSPQAGLGAAPMYAPWGGYMGLPAATDQSSAAWTSSPEQINQAGPLGSTEYFAQDLSQSLQMSGLGGASGLPLQHHHHNVGSTSSFPDAVSPSSSTSAVLTSSNVGSLEDVAPRPLFYSIIALYLRHLYPVYPVVHRPTLAHDLLTGRDLRDADFLALILSLAAATLALLPVRCYPSSLTEQNGATLHAACHAAAKRAQSRTYSPARLIHVVTLLLDNIYLGRTGASGAASAAFGEATRVAFMLSLHDERRWRPTGATESEIALEREQRARVFYVLYGIDKSIALLTDEPLGVHDDDVCVEHPPHTVEGDAEADLRAFTASVQLSILLSEVVRTARSRQPVTSVQGIDERLRHVEHVHQRAGRIVAELNAHGVAAAAQYIPQQQQQPSGLATPSLDSASMSSSSRGASRRSSHSTSRVPTEQLVGSLHQLLSTADSSVPPLRAEQANVLVSAAIVRFAATETSIKLLQLRSSGTEDGRAEALRMEMAAQETMDVLHALQHSDALVANGQILTGKLLYVATALMKRPGGDSSRALNAMLDYLSRLGDDTRQAPPHQLESR